MQTTRSPKHRPRTSIHRHPHSPDQATSQFQHLPASVLLLIATALAPPVLKHTFRPPGYRAAQRSLLSLALTCRALRAECFPLAAQVFRSPGLKPQSVADLGESATALEVKVDFLLAHEGLWGLVRKLDIEIHARGSQRLATKLAQLLTTLPNVYFLSLKLPSYHIFRDALSTDLRKAMSDLKQAETANGCWRRIRELCVDVRSTWMLELFPCVRELIVWSWPSEVVKQGGLTERETTDGWRSLLFGLNTQAPCVTEVEVGGLSVYDVNEIFPSLANYLGKVATLRFLHRKEAHGSIPLSHPSALAVIPSDLAESIRMLWEDTRDDEEYEGQKICGCPGGVQRIVYFDLQEEYGSCYVPSKDRPWMDGAPAIVLSRKDFQDRS
ncbi:hypothetical protein BDV93DRAFT_527953 [Ceratobasidium sp. AG-I]|nr:hypothetical protein BDV93DRAFT_527953 [Ceratobasidium sp. AG-I]